MALQRPAWGAGLRTGQRAGKTGDGAAAAALGLGGARLCGGHLRRGAGSDHKGLMDANKHIQNLMVARWVHKANTYRMEGTHNETEICCSGILWSRHI